mmetsp:Transcript_20672/g.30482  ORF Transcript_20672/g.30482 Transcript_20672/m.30482 type:complete len:235 (-) Transcript_20672:105-809(-)
MARQPKLKQALKKEAAAEKKHKAAAQAAKAAAKEDAADPSLMPLPEDDKATVKNKAIEVIKRGLATSQIQVSGDAYIPEVWASKFKPLLGPYRRFVETCGAFKVVQGEIPCKFTVHRMDERLPTSKLVTGARWEVKLRAAWQKYLEEHKESRAPKEFVDFVKQVVAQKAKVSDRSRQRLQEHKAKRALELQQKLAAAASGEGQGEEDDDDDDDDDHKCHRDTGIQVVSSEEQRI